MQHEIQQPKSWTNSIGVNITIALWHDKMNAAANQRDAIMYGRTCQRWTSALLLLSITSWNDLQTWAYALCTRGTRRCRSSSIWRHLDLLHQMSCYRHCWDRERGSRLGSFVRATHLGGRVESLKWPCLKTRCLSSVYCSWILDLSLCSKTHSFNWPL